MRPRPAQRIKVVKGPVGKVCMDEATIARARHLVATRGLGKTIILLRTSDTTLEKAMAGLPMVEAHARRLQARIAEVSAP